MVKIACILAHSGADFIPELLIHAGGARRIPTGFISSKLGAVVKRSDGVALHLLETDPADLFMASESLLARTTSVAG